jgi:Holliday junction resolvasome RuvABC DNA-binding subunit
MIDALRRKDIKALTRYDDLVDLDVHLAEQLAVEWNGAAAGHPDMNTLAAAIGKRLDAPGGEMKNGMLAAALLGNGVPEEQISEIMKQIEAARLSSSATASVPSAMPTNGKMSRVSKRESAPVTDPKDIRGADGDDVLEKLREAGLLDEVT